MLLGNPHIHRTCFIAVVGTGPAVSPRCACVRGQDGVKNPGELSLSPLPAELWGDLEDWRVGDRISRVLRGVARGFGGA